MRDQVDQRSTQAGERVSTHASDVRSVAGALRDQGQEQPAKLAEQAADRAEELGGYLQDADADRLLGDLEDLGRRQPMALVFGGLALGFAASRFIRASSRERYSAAPRSAGPPRPGRPVLPTPVPQPAGIGDAPGTLGAPAPPPRSPSSATSVRPSRSPSSARSVRSPGAPAASGVPGPGAVMSEPLGSRSDPRGPGGSGDLREEPIGELLKRLSNETTTLVKMELDLAKAEMTQKGKEAGKGAGLLSGGAVAGLMALGSLTAFLIILLDGAMPNWLAALLVTVLWAAVAGVLALQGKERLQDAAPPLNRPSRP